MGGFSGRGEIAGYRILELAGAGGMGKVYRAVQPRLERVVALKVIRPDLAADESFRRRFRREAQLAATVDHPGVVPVYEAGDTDDVLFVAMRWVAGVNLQRLLATERRLEPTRAVGMVRQVADALHAAHEVGLVHRDVKPANVLVEGSRIYLSDFGLARLATASSDTTVAAGITGTVDYLAPELLEGSMAGPAADVYALGCLLFELLTGSVPYPMQGLIAKLHAHAHLEPPAPSDLCPQLPRGIDRVVAQALAKDPADRFVSAPQLALATAAALDEPRLSLHLTHRTVGPLRRMWRFTRRRLAPTLVTAALLVMAFTAALNEPLESTRAQASPATHLPLQAHGKASTCDLRLAHAPCSRVVTSHRRRGRNAHTRTPARAGTPTPARARRSSAHHSQDTPRALAASSTATSAQRQALSEPTPVAAAPPRARPSRGSPQEFSIER
jgi:serine/threonine protein kinase